MADDLTARILQDYPAFGFLLNEPGLIDPETGVNLLIEAVDPQKPFDSATFQAKLLNTEWWKQSSAAKRSWETLAATDPATAESQKATWVTQVRKLALQNGVNLPPDTLDMWANTFLSQGVQAADPRILDQIVNLYEAEPAFRSGDAGNLQTITDQAQQIAGQYMIDLTPADYTYWSQRIARGDQTIQAFQDSMKTLAKGRFPSLGDIIDTGVTPTQYFSPYKTTIAKELEVPPDSVDLLHDPRWSQVLGTAQSDGTIRPMTLSESISLARQQPEWKRTSGANDLASGLGQQLLQTLGAIK